MALWKSPLYYKCGHVALGVLSAGQKEFGNSNLKSRVDSVGWLTQNLSASTPNLFSHLISSNVLHVMDFH